MTTSSALRPYQVEAVCGIHRELQRHRSTLVVMATGTGKTRTAIEAVKEYSQHLPARCGPERVLWLAHRDELIGQAEERFHASGFRDVGREQGKLCASTNQIVCGSVQTIKGKRLAYMSPDRFDLIVIDEAHRAAAKGYQAIVEHFANAKILGLTATPDRLDGKPLGDIFDSVAYEYPIDRAIREGWLAPMRSLQVVVDGLELGQVRRSRGDLNRGDLSRLMMEEGHIHAVVDPLLRLAMTKTRIPGKDVEVKRPTVVFAVDVEHGRAITDMLNRYRPRCADLVTGKQSRAMRRQIYRNHEGGCIQFLVNCEVLTEGWDAPYVSCIVIARPTMSRALYAQMVGRGTRLHPGKADLLVLDFVGNGGRHALIGPADVLAGEVVEPELRAAMARLKEEDPTLADLECLELAQLWLATERDKAAEQSAITAVAKFYTEQIDPFIGQVLRTGIPGKAYDYQVKALETLGFKLPPSLSFEDASELLLVVQDRKAAGLCSFKMARRLAQQGYANTGEMTMAEASANIAQCRARNWIPMRRRARR